MEYAVLEKPYGKEDIRMFADSNNWISGIVSIPLNVIINRDYGLFNCLLSEYLTATDLLLGVRYELVGCDGGCLHLKVEGDASEILRN